MKRKHFVRALAVAAACALGFNAQAVTKLEGATANTLQVSESGAGHFLIVPYFTTQSGNALLLSLINMDEVNGKAVKLRFRSARNADTLFDFQVFLAPGDMWTGNVSQNGNGLSYLTTSDASCSKPAKSVINATAFQTGRLDQNITAEERARETREGYVEIVTMADIPPSASGLFPLIDLNDGVARCSNLASNTAWTALDMNRAGLSDYTALGMQPPSSGLTANWTIMNVPRALSWSGSALAIEARSNGKAALGHLAVFPQSTASVSSASTYSADPLFAGTSAAVVARMTDLPDISTPYLVGVSQANQQAAQLADLLAVRTVKNEFWTEPSIDAATDWVFSMPTRRFAVGQQYATARTEGRWLVNKQVDRYFVDADAAESWPTSQMSSDPLTFPHGYCQIEPERSINDRETRYSANPAWSELLMLHVDFLCNAASVRNVDSPFSNSVGALHPGTRASLERGVLVANGWMKLDIWGGQGNGIPLVGHAFVRASNPNATPGVAGNYSVVWPHRLFKD